MKNKGVVTIVFFAFIAVLGCIVVNHYDSMRYDLNYGLPQIRIEFPLRADTLSRDYWIEKCKAEVVDADGFRRTAMMDVNVKGRGNSTFAQPKRPYNIKLEEPISILGLPARKRYVLLANFFDHSLMRNALAFEVARNTSLASTTPKGCHVELVVNGESQGVYYLCERAKDMVSKESILLEFDTYAYKEDKIVFKTKRNGLPVSVRNPDNLPKPLRKKMELLVNSLDSLPSEHVDLQSFVDYFIVQELCQNAEPNGPRSCFVHSNSNDCFVAGPVWDFDLAFNTVGVDSMNDTRPMRFFHLEGIRRLTSDSLYNSSALWYGEYMKNPKFVMMLKERWVELRPSFERLVTYIDSLDNLIRPAAIEDQRIWNHQEPARFDTCTTFVSGVNTLRRVYEERIVKLDSLIQSIK